MAGRKFGIFPAAIANAQGNKGRMPAAEYPEKSHNQITIRANGGIAFLGPF